MGVKAAESRLLRAIASGDKSAVLAASAEYEKQKIRAAQKRDKWKIRKRLSGRGNK